MTTKTPAASPAPAAPPAEPANPTGGGCYQRDPITGVLSPAPAPVPNTTPTE